MQPLAGLNIVVTRPREQALQLQQRIEQLGGNAVLFPLLEINPPADMQLLRDSVARLSGFDLAIFISPNAVRYGMAAIQAAGGLPSGQRIATVGQGSARALRDAGVTGVIAPQERSDSEALLALPALQHVRGWKVVIFRGDGGRELLGDTLKARGAGVVYVSCYQRGKPQQNIATLWAAKPDAITLSSSEALGHLWEMPDAANRGRLARIPLFVPHARIAAMARQQGWQKVVQTAGGDDGVVSGLVAWSKAQTHS
ncbi:MAG: uroporphyrinogen-III synthase [Gallionellaceae bacterium]|nr:MAG: uroporphyrinogen-III synthase [Gallionellaceae bacterium]